jgi:hypothetical protein
MPAENFAASDILSRFRNNQITDCSGKIVFNTRR